MTVANILHSLSVFLSLLLDTDALTLAQSELTSARAPQTRLCGSNVTQMILLVHTLATLGYLQLDTLTVAPHKKLLHIILGDL
jgi:hypothetical protein